MTCNRTRNGVAAIATERRWHALELRKAGKSYRAIAAELGCSPSTAFAAVADVLAVLAEQTMETAAEMRAIMAGQLDELWDSLWFDRRDPKVARVLLGILDRRARLFGLDAPVVHHVVEDASDQALDLEHLTDDELNRLTALLEKAGSNLTITDTEEEA